MSLAPEYVTTRDTYDKKYAEGYGLTYPDGHVVRLWWHVLALGGAGDEGEQHKNVFDFGCGTGTHLAFFAQQGFGAYGVDISADAISKAKDQLRPYGHDKNVEVIEPGQNVLRQVQKANPYMFFSNQTLYYLESDDIRTVVLDAYSVLGSGCFFYATMMSPLNYYFSKSQEINGSSLRQVILKGRLNEPSFINFVTKEEMIDLFKPFAPVHVGYYDSVIREDEGATHHWSFLGKK